MTAAQDSRAQLEDGAWYWVEKEGWIGDPPTIAPACYKAECDAWYSFAFSGIPTREVKVLEPCRRAALSAEPVASRWRWILEGGKACPWATGTVELLANETFIKAQQEGKFDMHPLYAAPQPAAQERKQLSEQEIDDIWNEVSRAGYSNPPHDIARAVERAHGITGEPK